MRPPTPDAPPGLRFPFDMDDVDADPLRTERMLLRPIRASDADDVYEYQRLPEVLRYIPWPERDRLEGRQHTLKRARARRLEHDDDAVIFAMELVGEPSVSISTTDAAADRAPSDRVIGDVMIRVGSVEHAQLELGWVVHPAFQRRGLAAEAAAAVMAFAFARLGAHRVSALLDARNAASATLCERLGMRREATILEEEFNDGEWQDTVIYGVLAREWSAHTAAAEWKARLTNPK